MSTGFGDSVQPKWIYLGPRWEEFTIISELHSWYSHWEPNLRRSRRCGGPSCALCAMGRQKVLRVNFMAVDISGRDRLGELRERHRAMLDQYPHVAGLRIRMRKGGTANNAPVQMEVIDTTHVVVRDISRLVDVLGLEPLVGVMDDAWSAGIADQLGGSCEDPLSLVERVPNPEGFEDFE